MLGAMASVALRISYSVLNLPLRQTEIVGGNRKKK
jgi:hypothetical protein